MFGVPPRVRVAACGDEEGEVEEPVGGLGVSVFDLQGKLGEEVVWLAYMTINANAQPTMTTIPTCSDGTLLPQLTSPQLLPSVPLAGT